MTGEPVCSCGSRNTTVSAPGFTPIFMPSLLRALVYSFPEPSQINTPLSLWLLKSPSYHSRENWLLSHFRTPITSSSFLILQKGVCTSFQEIHSYKPTGNDGPVFAWSAIHIYLGKGRSVCSQKLQNLVLSSVVITMVPSSTSLNHNNSTLPELLYNL